jgi:hypothetical protein
VTWVANTARIDEIAAEEMRPFPCGFGRCGFNGVALSLCHAWSGGVTAWLSEHVLGIRPKNPGCTAVEVRPKLGDLDWVEGTFPTPHGILRMRHSRNADGTVATQLEAPPQVEVLWPQRRLLKSRASAAHLIYSSGTIASVVLRDELTAFRAGTDATEEVLEARSGPAARASPKHLL